MNFKELGANLGLDEEEYRELIELFVESGHTDYQRLKTAFRENDVDEIKRRAHTIRGAAGNLGLKDICATACGIENKAVKGQIDRIQDDVRTLETQIKAITAALEE